MKLSDEEFIDSSYELDSEDDMSRVSIVKEKEENSQKENKEQAIGK